MKLKKTKARALMLSVCLLYITIFSSAQFKTPGIGNSASSLPPIKGYYGIYNNAQKLNSSQLLPIVIGTGKSADKATPGPKKGYYTIGDNAQTRRIQLAKEITVVPGETPRIKIQNLAAPVKGYYSIGENAKKLQ
jgi:hypothetical protein